MRVPTPTDAPPAAVSLRIRHVDSLRAVAAGLVVWTHTTQLLSAATGPDPKFLGFLHRLPRDIDLGRVGVMIFFAVSGFVICRSFGGPRQGGARRFVLKRFCRLYPAFWTSILVAALAGWLREPTLTWGVVAANATMVPSLFGQPYLLGVYWTLEIELLFYALCLGLYLARSLERRALLAACSLALAALPRVLRAIDHAAGTHLALSPGQPTFVLSLAVMFWGALFRLVYDGTDGFRRGIFTGRGTLLLALLTLALIDIPEPYVKWYLLGLRPGPMPGHMSAVVALLVFVLWVACLRVDNVVLTHLGVVSYSWYLFHVMVVFSFVHLLASSRIVSGWHAPFWVFFVLCTGISAALASAVYQWVERPSIALGKRWAGSLRPARPS